MIIDTINSGKVPDLSEGAEKTLEGQVGLSIVKNSISNIVVALGDLSKNSRKNVARLRHLLPLVAVVVVMRSYLSSWRESLFGRAEMGCTFGFTLRRLRMISRLTRKIKI